MNSHIHDRNASSDSFTVPAFPPHCIDEREDNTDNWKGRQPGITRVTDPQCGGVPAHNNTTYTTILNIRLFAVL